MMATTQNRTPRFPTFTSMASTDSIQDTSRPSLHDNNWSKGSSIWGPGAIGSTSFRLGDNTTNLVGSEPQSQLGSRTNSTDFGDNGTSVWPSQQGYWSNTAGNPARNASGNTSPVRTRDSSTIRQEPTSNTSYFGQNSAAVGHNGVSTMSRMNSDPQTRTFQQTNLNRDTSNDRFGPHNSFGPRRPYGSSQDLSQYTLNTTDNMSMPPSRHSETDNQSQFGGYSPSRSGRPGLNANSASFPAQSSTHRGSHGSNVYDADGNALHDRFRSNLSISSGSNSMKTALNGGFEQGNQYSQNSAQQPWLNEVASHSRSSSSVQQQSVYIDNYNIGQQSGRTPDAGNYQSAPPSATRSSFNSPRDAPAWPSTNSASRPTSRMSAYAPERAPPALGTMGPPQLPPQQFYPNPALSYNPAAYTGQYGQPQYDLYQYSQFGRPPIPSYLDPNLANGVNGYPPRHREAGFRSRRMEDFRTTSKYSRKWELKEIYGHVPEFAGDQNGSRFIQAKLETANSDEREQIFGEVLNEVLKLTMDVFGNYVIQKFFEHGTQLQKKMLADALRGKIVQLSRQTYACRVVQKALEYVLGEQQVELIEELRPDIITIIKDQHGNHVVQKIIEVVKREHIQFIMDAFTGRVGILARDPYGCRVIQRLLEKGTESDKAVIVAELRRDADALIQDQYGNYVMQHVVEHGKPEDREAIISLVIDEAVALSKHKCASNAVEKCIEHGTAEQKTQIRAKVSALNSDGTSQLQQMVRDQYGNYVIQKLLTQLPGDEPQKLAKDVEPFLEQLTRHSGGRGGGVAAFEKLGPLVTEVLKAAAAKNAATTDTAAEKDTLETMTTDAAASADNRSTLVTPALTTGPDSPQSISAPSTNSDAAGTGEVESGGAAKDEPSQSLSAPEIAS